jgi:uncharacterized membrane protein
MALAVVLSAAFAVLAHASIVEGVPPAVGALLSLIPIAIIAASLLRRSRHRLALLALVALAGVAIVLGWGTLERHFPSVLFFEHAGINLMLAVVFGRTLAAGHDPLVTRFARLLHRELPPEVVAYTRRVTIAWTIFFATLFVLSCVLYLGGFLAGVVGARQPREPDPGGRDVRGRVRDPPPRPARLGARRHPRRAARVLAAFRHGAIRGAALGRRAPCNPPRRAAPPPPGPCR